MCQNRRGFKELTVGVPLKELTDYERERETLSCLSVRLPVFVFIRHVISHNSVSATLHVVLYWCELSTLR
jgi:hypothetical protein